MAVVKRLAVVLAIALLAAFASAGSNSVAGEPPHYCPRHDPDHFDANRLEGKRLYRAREIARNHDCSVRVVKRNGEWLPVTDDFVANRINVFVRDRRVTRVYGVH